jgi:hypothetical protein
MLNYGNEYAVCSLCAEYCVKVLKLELDTSRTHLLSTTLEDFRQSVPPVPHHALRFLHPAHWHGQPLFSCSAKGVVVQAQIRFPRGLLPHLPKAFVGLETLRKAMQRLDECDNFAALEEVGVCMGA